MHLSSRKAQLGLNLVELMIGLVVGLIVLAAMTTVYLNASRGSKDTLNANRLNQDLRAVMDIMVADIRRAGYWGTAAAGSSNLFTVRASSGTNSTDIYVSNVGTNSDCILYTYDATYKTGNTAGTVDATDYFGFRRRIDATTGNGVIAALTPTTTNANCSALSGDPLNDPAVIDISAVTFSTGVPPTPPSPDSCATGQPASTEPGSQCLNADTGATWVEPVDGTNPACSDTGATGYVAPTAGHRLAETRQITICIQASHASDPTLTRTLRETVLVRNNRLCTFGTNC